VNEKISNKEVLDFLDMIGKALCGTDGNLKKFSEFICKSGEVKSGKMPSSVGLIGKPRKFVFGHIGHSIRCKDKRHTAMLFQSSIVLFRTSKEKLPENAIKVLWK
jgi:hypothetical protein